MLQPTVYSLGRSLAVSLVVTSCAASSTPSATQHAEAPLSSPATTAPTDGTKHPLEPAQRANPEQRTGLYRHFQDEFSLGVALEPRYLEPLGPLIRDNFNRLTAENVMKFARIHPKPEEYAFAPADQLADFARQNSMRITGHALVWHRETPDWLVEGGEAATVAARLKQHIDTVVARYADVTDNWDVVNEIISDSAAKTFRDGDEGSKLFSVLGEELPILAFQYAEAAVAASGKPVDLYYNDYNIVLEKKRAKAIQLARTLKSRGVRIDGIGAQAHWNLTWPTVAEVQQMIDDIVAEGLKVKISELDISIYTRDDWTNKVWQPEQPFTEELAAQQAARYKELFEVFIKNAQHITSVTFWGLSDDHTWLDNEPVKGRDNHPLLFDDQDQPKPAYYSLLDL